MRRRTLLTLIACTMFVAVAVYVAQAQTGPAAPTGVAPGGAAPGGAMPGVTGGDRRGGMGGFSRGPAEPPGPPAPVPPEVAIPRPTAEEVAKINAELQQFVNSNTGADKDLLKKYASLMVVQVPRDNPCIRPTAARGGRHESFVETAKNGDFDILFYGDSITDLLGTDNDGQGNPGGKSVVAKYLSDVKFANFGISGDTTQGVLWRLQNGEGQGHKPRAVMLMIGTNNMNGNTSGAEIAEGIGAIVLELHKDFPDAKIMLLAIFPRGASPTDSNRRKVEECNKIIAKLHDGQHVFFTNINDKFLTPEGRLIGFRTTDNLHPVTEGFEIWISSVAPTLKSWVK
jgi:lysophospholipase L1-like esterase